MIFQIFLAMLCLFWSKIQYIHTHKKRYIYAHMYVYVCIDKTKEALRQAKVDLLKRREDAEITVEKVAEKLSKL